jgi:monodehydroascorbate reductase (NADH)
VPRLFTADLASFYEGYYEGKGITILKGPKTTGFEIDATGHVSGNKSLENSGYTFTQSLLCKTA